MTKTLFARTVLILLAAPAAAQPVFVTHTADYPIDGATLGDGWFSPAGLKASGRCILFEEKVDRAQDSSMRFTQVRDKDSLMQSLEVSAEFEAKAIIGRASG